MDNQNIETLEALLAASCVLLNDAAAIPRTIGVPPEKELLHTIANALLKCWDARELIYKERPDLKPLFITDAEQYPEVEEAYYKALQEAVPLEQEGRIGDAVSVYERFLQTAPDTFFRRVVEFRIVTLKSVP